MIVQEGFLKATAEINLKLICNKNGKNILYPNSNGCGIVAIVVTRFDLKGKLLRWADECCK
jgi:hypothetical protein